jgi:hypothetical protein
MSILAGTLAVTGAAAAGAAKPAAVSGHKTGAAAGNPFCAKLKAQHYLASAGAWAFCFGAAANTAGTPRAAAVPHSANSAAPRNVNAASLAEDVSPSGVRAYGQSETSIAAAGHYVVEAWNDSTTFFTLCGATQNKEEGTGFAFSADGGKTFTDLGGLPNANCNNSLYGGDPSVAAYQVGGKTYFYISSLFNPTTGNGPSQIAMDACEVSGTGGTATLSCGQPVIIGNSTFCKKVKFGNQTVLECDFLDKDFITVDPAHHRLYAAYTDFPLFGTTFGTNIDASVCDLGNAAGGTGPAGGTPAAPVCETNKPGAAPYLNITPAAASACENEGAYPAADPATGALYVGYEFNLGSNTGYPPCSTAATPTSDVLSKVPFSCLPLATTATCGPSARIGVPLTSIDAEPIPGFNRAPTDWPRLAVSDPAGTVSMVWNDARYHPLGDVLLQSFSLGTLAPVQSAPVLVDKPVAGGLNFMPAVRAADASGKLDVTWFSRKSATTANTDVYAAIGINPRATTAPAVDTRITSVASNWDNSTSDITPNFGDYTDNNIVTTGTWPYVGSTLYVAWSDGRLGVPQPFEAHLPG